MDLDFYALTETCLQIPLDKLFKGGFSTGHGYLREPESIRSYAALTAIALQCNQNEMHGGQSIPALDYYLAPGVCKSYISEICRVLDDKYDISDEMKSELKKELRSHCEELNYHFMSDKGSEVIKSVLNSKGFDDEQIEKAKTKALKYTEKETYQAMEALVHNLNSMHSRAGAQVPFTSVNFGTDTSEEGRMVSRNLLLSTESGLGAGETAIFPISIFKVKEGVNYNPEDPNYDLFKLSIRVSAKRLFPTYEFLDAPYNLQYYKKGDFRTELATMGCVEEHSEIKIRYQGVVEYIRFKYLFEKIKELGLKLQTRGRAEYFDTSTIGLEVYDTYSGGFVKVLTLLRNKNVYGWRELDFNNGSALVATLDHPLPIEGKGRTYVSDIAVGDKICEAESKRVLEIIKIVDRGDSFDGGYSYDVETESDRFDVNGIQSHNCRTRVIGNVYDPTREIVTGRGNLSFTSINLPRLGIEAHGDIDKFFELLDEKMYLVKRQLTKRFKLQCSKHVYNYPFLMGQGLWLDSDKLGPNDTLEDILPHGSLSLGFLGLAECLVALIGEHHGQSDKAQELGLKIIGHMRELTDMWQKEDYINSKGKAIHLNWSILGTPAEGLSGTFLKKDRKKYGIIPGVTDKEYYTNSSHIPVGFKISFVDKIKKEAPYHALENAGHICYVEFDGDATKNLEAFEAIIRCMKENGVGYGAVNIPVDRDPVCGYTGIIGDICPKCGRDVREPISQREINEIRRKFGLTTPFNLSHSCSGDC